MSGLPVKPTIEDVLMLDEIAADQARQIGCEILIATPNDLFIDLDDRRNHRKFREGFRLLEEQVGYPEILSWKSKSGNFHIHLKFSDIAFSVQEQIAWQLILGSDPERERWCAIKDVLGVNGNRLFKPKDAKNYTGVPIMLYCVECETVSCLTKKEYMRQLSDPDRKWRCGNCGMYDCEVIE